MEFKQTNGYTLGGFTVGHAATICRCAAVGTIVGVDEREGRCIVTVEFDEPQPVDVPEGATSKRFELAHTAITSTWEKSGTLPNSPAVKLNSIDVYAHAGTMAGLASKRRDTSCAAFHSDWAKRAMALESPDYRQVARKAFDDAYRAEATPTVALG